MTDIIPPQQWRVIGDEPQAEIFIPLDGSKRSRRIFEAVVQMSPEEAAALAAGYLEEHAPDDPYLKAYRELGQDFGDA